MLEEPLLTPERLAELIGFEKATLTKWRNRRKGPKFIRLGNNTVRYRPADVEAWLKSRAAGPPEAPKRKRGAK
jgi:predicted DNA-binding transcriptional regulator AlpA